MSTFVAATAKKLLDLSFPSRPAFWGTTRVMAPSLLPSPRRQDSVMPSPLRTTQLRTLLPAGATTLAQSKHLANALEQSRRAVERLQRENEDLRERSRKLSSENDELHRTLHLERAEHHADREDSFKRLKAKDQEIEAACAEAEALRAKAESAEVAERNAEKLCEALANREAALQKVYAQRTSSFGSQLNLAARLTRDVSASFKAVARADNGASRDVGSTNGPAAVDGTDCMGEEENREPDTLAPSVPEAVRPSAQPPEVAQKHSRYVGPYLYKGASRESSAASTVASSVATSEAASPAAPRGVSRNAARRVTSPRPQGTHPISASAPPPSPRSDASRRSSAYDISSASSSGSASESTPSTPAWTGPSSPLRGTAEHAADPLTTPLYGRRAAQSAAKPPAAR